MISRAPRIEVRRASSYIGLTLQQVKLARERSLMPKPIKSATTSSAFTLPSIQEEEYNVEKLTIERVIQKQINPDQKCVYLYMQLEGLVNMPQSDTGKMKLRLSHQQNQVTLMSERMAPTNEVQLSELRGDKPFTFTMTIDQDDVDHINGFSDNPLRLMILDVVPVLYENEMGLVELREEEVLVSEGIIDLLPFFTKQRKLSKVETFLYPMEITKATAAQETTKSNWQIYSLIPLLRNVKVHNVVFITFESIYDMMPELVYLADQLVAQLYFQSKIPNRRKQYEKQKLCSFSNFEDELIFEQDHNTRWETMVPDPTDTIDLQTTMSSHSGVTIVQTQKLMQNLLCTEGLHEHLQDVNVDEDDALICNSMRRYVLTEELSKILEDVVAFNEQEILVEIHTQDNPNNVLLKGVIDLSIFLYPRVNSCRFAVKLIGTRRLLRLRRLPKIAKFSLGDLQAKPDGKQLSSGDSSTRSSARKIKRMANSPSPSIQGLSNRLAKRKKANTFAIINICLNTPITENEGEKRLGSINVAQCFPIPNEKIPDEVKTNDDLYREFDEVVREIVDHILITNTRVIEHDQEYFCGQVRNLTNRILKLIQFDYNVRVRTKTHIQFSNLMTLVFKELEERMSNIVRSCGDRDMKRCRPLKPEIRERIVILLTQAKYMWEVDDFEFYYILMEKVHKLGEGHRIVEFFLMLIELERQNFDAVGEYLRRPIDDRYKLGEKITNYICIYVNYVKKLKSEEEATTATEYLTTTLTTFAKKHVTLVESWILLYCVYKSCGYTPGMSYCRWKYENLFGLTVEEPWISVPKSRFAIYHLPNYTFDTVKGQNFYHTLHFFWRHGMYKFGEFIYKDLTADSKDDAQKYCIASTLTILQNEPVKRLSARGRISTISTASDSGGHVDESIVAQAHVNGHLQYYMDKVNVASAMVFYEKVLRLERVFEHDDYELGLLRYGYYMMARRNYESAAKAFEKIYSTDNSLASLMALGKCKYLMGNLEESVRLFAESTKYKVHIPNAWAYLALINIRQKNTWRALECWKYARIHSEVVICDDVLNELEEVDYNKLNLYVDAPSCSADAAYLNTNYSWSQLAEELEKKSAGDSSSLGSGIALSGKSMRRRRMSKASRFSRQSRMIRHDYDRLPKRKMSTYKLAVR